MPGCLPASPSLSVPSHPSFSFELFCSFHTTESQCSLLTSVRDCFSGILFCNYSPLIHFPEGALDIGEHTEGAGMLAMMEGAGAPLNSSGELLAEPSTSHCSLRHKHWCHLTQQFRDLGCDLGQTCSVTFSSWAVQLQLPLEGGHALSPGHLADCRAQLLWCQGCFLKLPINLLSLAKWFIFLLFLMFKYK